MESETAMVEHKYQLNVKMTCGGCSGAVSRVLKKAQDEGSISNFNVDLATQLVDVTGPIEEEDLKLRIQKTNKEIVSFKVLDSED